jgi:dimethylargininase
LIVRIPLSLRTRGIEIDVAKKEFEAYVQLLRELELDVIEMPQDEESPESVFIEDTAIVCNNIALLTKPGNANRLKEVTKFKTNYSIEWNCVRIVLHAKLPCLNHFDGVNK